MTRWGRVVHASVVHTGTEQMLTLQVEHDVQIRGPRGLDPGPQQLDRSLRGVVTVGAWRRVRHLAMSSKAGTTGSSTTGWYSAARARARATAAAAAAASCSPSTPSAGAPGCS
jgi:hypothetical protein